MLFLLLFFPIFLTAQETPLVTFKSFEKYVWKAEGIWENGSKFKQEISFELTLNNKIVIIETKGYTNKEQTEFGLRNHGIRYFEEETNKIKFLEFDIYGSVTEGILEIDKNNLLYWYNYGDTLLTEMWVHKNERTYDFIIGIYENGVWKQKFLETEFIGSDKYD